MGAESAEACVRCGPGTYGTAAGASSNASCVACGPGQYQDGEGAVGCKTCSLGSCCAAAGMAVQEPCPTQRYCPGVTQCMVCGAGTYNDRTFQIRQADCLPCPAGQYCAQGQGRQPCPPGTYSKHAGAAACEE